MPVPPSPLLEIAKAALAACAVDPAMRKAVNIAGRNLHVAGQNYDLSHFRRVSALGAGKAAAAMAQTLGDLLGPALSDGLMITKYGHGLPLDNVHVLESAHPVPDQAGEKAAETLLHRASIASRDDLIFFLLSGGASALIPSPRPPVTLEDKMQTTRLLLACGADIHEINAIRKHLSRIKGGHLAAALAPATVITLIVSDVLGDNLDVIGSGPTAPDQSTFADCLSIIDRHALRREMPASVLTVLEQGAAGLLPETAKIGQDFFTCVQHHIIASNGLALDGAATAARRLGYAPHILSTNLSGDVQDAAIMLAQATRNHKSPVCLLAGGETTVTVRGNGKGGRNQELALRLALELEKHPTPAATSVLCLGTDGSDGPTDAAGGLLRPETLARARAKGLHPEPYLENNDSYTFLKQAEALLITGPTRTNLMDIVAVLLDPRK